MTMALRDLLGSSLLLFVPSMAFSPVRVECGRKSQFGARPRHGHRNTTTHVAVDSPHSAPIQTEHSAAAAIPTFRPSTPAMSIPQYTCDYSFVDFLVGPKQADYNLVQFPSELRTLGDQILDAAPHLERSGRVLILQALMQSYDSYRLQQIILPLTVEQYLTRIARVTTLLGQSGVDAETLAAAILSQAPLSAAEVELTFGLEVHNVLQGYLSMTRMEGQLEIRSLLYDYAKRLWGEESSNLRNLLLSVAGDWRSVALRVAWKRIEMDGNFSTKKERIDDAWAGLNIYSSLAEKAGMSIIKNEIEELAFSFLMPQEHARIREELDDRAPQDQVVLKEARREILQALAEDGVLWNHVERVEIKGRVKSPYSVWKKARRRNCTANDVFDVVALRVICTPIYDPRALAPEKAQMDTAICNYVQSVVHRIRPHYLHRVRDFLTEPKPNGYQSLHTTLQWRLRGKKYPLEVQIRTKAMHASAEHGLAAHSLYKGEKGLEGFYGQAHQSKGELLQWLQQAVAREQVIFFDPIGRLVKLAKGSTVLDALRLYRDGLKTPLSSHVVRRIRLNGQRAHFDRELTMGDVLTVED